MKLHLLLFFLCSSLLIKAEENFKFDLSPLLKVPECWQVTPDQFEEKFTEGENAFFKWLTKDRTRALLTRRLYTNATIDFSILEGEVPVEEALVDFENGKLKLLSFSIYNRAESKDLDQEVFDAVFKRCGKMLSKALATKPQKRKANSQQGLLTEGFFWKSAQGFGLLEHNEGAREGKDIEFLRMRFAHPKAKSRLATAMLNSRGGSAVRISQLAQFVKKDEKGNVYITEFPMIDQGDKGYCVVASAQRVLEYYGVGVDMHQLAEVADSDPNTGTNTLQMVKELDQIDYRFKTRLNIIGMKSYGRLTEADRKKGEYYIGKPVDERKFLKALRSSIDEGIPLLWTLELGKFKEEPELLPQTTGGHMRTIIGYNDETKQIIFTDSWGAGHEFKTMSMSDAYRASDGLFQLKPTIR